MNEALTQLTGGLQASEQVRWHSQLLKDQEQELVGQQRDGRGRERANHRHCDDDVAYSLGSMAMSIGSPHEATRQPGPGVEYQHLCTERDGEEIATVVERQTERLCPKWRQRRDAATFGREGPDGLAVDSEYVAVLVDAHSAIQAKVIAIPSVLVAAHEQERTIVGRQYLQAIVPRVGNDESISSLIDRDRGRYIPEAWHVALRADREQEREILQRQELQAIVARINDDHSLAAIVDRDAARMVELALSRTVLADRQEVRVGAQRPHLHAMVVGVRDQDALVFVIDRNASRLEELALLGTERAELGDERSIIRREHLHAIVARISDEQEALLLVERQTIRDTRLPTRRDPGGAAFLLAADRELDPWRLDDGLRRLGAHGERLVSPGSGEVVDGVVVGRRGESEWPGGSARERRR